jgi:hypothetical protein
MGGDVVTGFTRTAAYELYKNDYQFHDGMEEVSILQEDGYEIKNVQAKQELTNEQAVQMGEGILDAQVTVLWVVWDSTLNGEELNENDVIQQSNGDRWRIKSVSRQLWDTQWHCQTKKDAA